MLLAAALVILIIGTTTAVFVVCQDCRTAGPFTLVRAQHGLYRFTTGGLWWVVVFKIQCLIHID